MGIDCKWTRQRHIINAAIFKNTCHDIRVVGTKESSSYRSLAYEVHFPPAHKFHESKGSIISPKNFCLKLFMLVIHHQILVHQKRNAVRLSPKHNSEVAVL